MNRKTISKMHPVTLRVCRGWVLLAAGLALLPIDLHAQETKSTLKRHAILHMSDGEQREGIIELSRGTEFHLTNLKRNDTGAAAPVEADKFSANKSKIYTFNFNVVKAMRFAPHSEEYLKKFKMLNVSFRDDVDDDGNSRVKKARVGLPYPVIKPKCTVVFNSGEVVTGVLNTRVVYLTTVDPDTGFKIKTTKIVVKSKYSGEPGQSYDDLVRVKHIQMLDEGDQFARNMPIEFGSFDFDAVADKSGLCALTQDTLTKVRVQKDADGTVRVHSTLGENVFLAAEVNGMWVAGWPAEGTTRTDLFRSVETEFSKVLDYYNERKLLGIISKKNGREITALVRLRRDIPDPEFALAWAKGVGGGFELGPDGKLLEYYRMSILKFVRDPKTGQLSLEGRGTFSRTRIDLDEKTPEMGTSPDLWPVVMKDGTLLVGSKEEGDTR